MQQCDQSRDRTRPEQRGLAKHDSHWPIPCSFNPQVNEMTRRLFGTDGIRGKVIDASSDEEASINALHEQRVISTTLLRIVGEALGRTMDQLPGEGTKAVIGWDDRPKNTELVAALTLGLRLT